MTQGDYSSYLDELKAQLVEDRDFFKEMVRDLLEEVMEAEMEQLLGAAKYERTEDRTGLRGGYYPRGLKTRVGKLDLRVPRDRDGKFDTQVFERYKRSEKALVTALAEMYVQGVSTRKVGNIVEKLCGYSFSASTISRFNKQLDEKLEAFARRQLDDEYGYVFLDARYEKVRENHVVRDRAVLIALGVNSEGRRCILGVELANGETETSWKEFLLGLKERGLRGVGMVISDAHPGLKTAVMQVLPQAVWQRCYAHFLRNASNRVPASAEQECLEQLKDVYHCSELDQARASLGSWLDAWEGEYGDLCDWVEEEIEQTLCFYSLPREHRRHMRSTNVLERFNQEIKRRTRVVRIFPNPESCLRLIRALAVEQHEQWMHSPRYVNMELINNEEARNEQRAQQSA